MDNGRLFEELRSLNLPTDDYIIVASGPLGIRGLREMSDIDILVSDKLWSELEKECPIFYEHEAMKLRLSTNVEAMCQASFGDRKPGTPTSTEQILDREMIDGLPFQNIKLSLYFKRLGKRKKDINDVKLIENWLKENS